MTDGIIQQIIGEYINMEINAKKKGFQQMHVDYESVFKTLQQELIEEIKKEIINAQTVAYNGETIIQKLIGDNNE